MHKKILYFFWIFLFTLSINAQKSVVEAKVDSTSIKIGAQLNLTLKTKVAKKSVVIFPEAQQFGAFEVLESFPTDTIKKSDAYELIKRYGLTKFDSGKYVVPRLSVVINDQVHFSDSISVTVADVVVDTLKQKMYDIRPIIDTEKSFSWQWLWWLLLPITLFIFYYLFKKYRSLPKAEEEEHFATPIEKAVSLLSRLEEKELWQKGAVKDYYIELTGITRTYLEEALRIHAMESTTSELIESLRAEIELKKMSVSADVLQHLDKILKNADLVKFAKSKPLDFEITSDRNQIEKIITTINQAIPEEIVVAPEQEQQTVKQKKKVTQKQWIAITIGALIFLYAGIGYLVFDKGLDLFGGKSSKSIFEGDWYASEYGNPSLKLTTPDILTRIEKNKSVFTHGSIADNLYILVETRPTQEKVDLELELNKILKALESKGAHSILVDQDDYQTTEGFTGKKAFGSFSMPVSIGEEEYKRVRYEMLLFAQEGAVQQVLVVYKDQDEYAEKVKQKIINSVELKKVH